MGDSGPYTLFSSGGEDRAGALPIPPGLEAPPHWLTYLGTADADATAARAAELGGVVQREPFDVPTVGRIGVLADPAGAYVGIFQPASE
jgi:predicted enzyme related to lactoylglutathione lyase